MTYFFFISAFKGFMTGLYVLTFGTVPLLLAVLLFAYCSKYHSLPMDWNKTNRKKSPYVSTKHLQFIQSLQNLAVDDGGNGKSNACTSTTAARPLPSITTVSSLVTQYDDGIYSEAFDASSFYHNMSEPIYDTIVENAYVNNACSVPQTECNDVIKSRLKKSDIVITNLMSTTNPQVNSYLQDGVWIDSK